MWILILVGLFALVTTMMLAALKGSSSLLSFIVQFGLALSFVFIVIMVFVVMALNALGLASICPTCV